MPNQNVPDKYIKHDSLNPIFLWFSLRSLQRHKIFLENEWFRININENAREMLPDKWESIFHKREIDFIKVTP